MTAYYNELDPYAAQWLRNLVREGTHRAGDVDERSIEDVHPDDLRGYTQCHFFAGIGIWSHALRRAGWPDDRPIWTGSCPCQPFSAAGQGAGFADERHLWPAFFHLIRVVRPVVVLGEQVASKDGLAWLDLVQADLEGAHYTSGAVDTCSAGFGAPHIRQRLYWMGVSNSAGLQPWRQGCEALGYWRAADAASSAGLVADAGHEGLQVRSIADDGQRALWLEGPTAAAHVVSGELADADIGAGRQGCEDTRGCDQGSAAQPRSGLRGGSGAGELEQPSSIGWQRRQEATPRHDHDGQAPERPQNQHGRLVTGAPSVPAHGAGPVNGFWAAADWLFCRDDKWRPVEEGTFPLAHGDTGRVGGLRAYGNAINAEQATAFCEAVQDWLYPAIDAERVRLIGAEDVFA